MSPPRTQGNWKKCHCEKLLEKIYKIEKHFHITMSMASSYTLNMDIVAHVHQVDGPKQLVANEKQG
jgi:hypothetical protein